MAKIWLEMVVKQPFMSRKFDAPPSSALKSIKYLREPLKELKQYPVSFIIQPGISGLKPNNLVGAEWIQCIFFYCLPFYLIKNIKLGATAAINR